MPLNCCFMATSHARKHIDPSPTVGDLCAAVSLRCWLRRDGANRTSDTQPLVEVRERIRKMQHNAARGGFDPNTEFEKPLAQRVNLRIRKLSNSGAQAQLLPQYVGSRSE